MLCTRLRLLPRLAARPRFSSTVMAAVIERSPVLTPDLPEWQQQEFARREDYIKFHKVYPRELTDAEEGPDQKRAREKVQMVVERDGGRLGAGDKSGDEATSDRRLAERLYLVVCIDRTWQFPQALWSPEQSAHACVLAEVANRCGSELAVHPMGNAPMAHLELPDETRIFFYRLLHTGGDIEPAAGVTDHAWLTREELSTRLDPATAALAAEMCGPF